MVTENSNPITLVFIPDSVPGGTPNRELAEKVALEYLREIFMQSEFGVQQNSCRDKTATVIRKSVSENEY